MKIKKFAALATACVMSLSVLAGCGNSDDKTSSKEKEESSTVERKYKSKYKLSNPNADDNASKVYDYICENFGKKMISCQQESTWKRGPDYEIQYIAETTGKKPAMRGLDFMNSDFNGVVERAAEWWSDGGLVTICWHTGVNGNGYDEARDDYPDFSQVLTEGTPENKEMIANWDKAAEALKLLSAQGVPVLWRPFHEFDGQWFWWGKGGREDFKKLWKMMYDRFTNKFGLTNLIWVLGYSGSVKDDWYPGDEYVDILGSDAYNDDTNAQAWPRLKAISDTKPLAYHECGNLPSVEEFKKEGALWSWFMVWHTDHIINNDKKNLKEVYNHEDVITLDELPNFLEQ